MTNKQGKLYTFFLSSEYERSEWLKSLQEVQKALPPNPLMLHAQAKAMSMAGLQGYLTKYRQHLQVRIHHILYPIYKRVKLNRIIYFVITDFIYFDNSRTWDHF